MQLFGLVCASPLPFASSNEDMCKSIAFELFLASVNVVLIVAVLTFLWSSASVMEPDIRWFMTVALLIYLGNLGLLIVDVVAGAIRNDPRYRLDPEPEPAVVGRPTAAPSTPLPSPTPVPWLQPPSPPPRLPTPLPSKKINILIKSFMEKDIVVWLDVSSTLGYLKKQISYATDLRRSTQMLCYQGRLPEEHHCLMDYCINYEGVVVWLIVKDI